MSARRGAVLIVVSGLSALVLALTVAFLARMRADQEESQVYLREIQARVMLGAALQYVAEGARIGWDSPATAAEHDEAYGWVDVRDGRPGPRNQHGEMLYAGDPATGVGPAYPAVDGRAARCPMHLRERPPWALENRLVVNPLPNTDDATASFTAPWAQMVALREAAPRPAGAADGYDAWAAGDPRPRAASTGMAWFRARRIGVARFVVTCGAGATAGWRSWDEIPEDQREAFGSRALFDELRAAEVVLWYEAEWSPAVGYNNTYRNHYAKDDPGNPASHKGEMWDLNELGSIRPVHSDTATQEWGSESMNSRQLAGTFLYIQRLHAEPPEW